MNTRGSSRVLNLQERAGASTVEMAVIAPVLLTMVFGILQIAYAYMVQHLIQDAARQGCRVGVCYGQTNSGVLSQVNTLLNAESVTQATTTILVNSAVANVSSANTGDEITVQITVPASAVTIVPGMGFISGQLTAQCMMRHN